MRAFLAVVRREFSAHRLLLALALALGLLPVLFPLLPTLAGQKAEDVRFGVLLVVLVIVGIGVPLVLGSSLLVRDLGERRAGFYLSRPIGTWALWLGKLTAAWLLIFLVLALVALPTLLIGGGSETLSMTFLTRASQSFSGAEPFLLPNEAGVLEELLDQRTSPFEIGTAWGRACLAAFPLLVLLMVHTLGILLRSRSAWLVADVIGGFLASGLAVWSAGILIGERAAGPLRVLESAWLLVLPAVLLIVGGMALLRGRVDLDHHHRTFSLGLWPALCLVFLGSGLYGHWVVGAEIDDLILLCQLLLL